MYTHNTKPGCDVKRVRPWDPLSGSKHRSFGRGAPKLRLLALVVVTPPQLQNIETLTAGKQ